MVEERALLSCRASRTNLHELHLLAAPQLIAIEAKLEESCHLCRWRGACTVLDGLAPRLGPNSTQHPRGRASYQDNSRINPSTACRPGSTDRPGVDQGEETLQFSHVSNSAPAYGNPLNTSIGYTMCRYINWIDEVNVVCNIKVVNIITSTCI